MKLLNEENLNKKNIIQIMKNIKEIKNIDIIKNNKETIKDPVYNFSFSILNQKLLKNENKIIKENFIKLLKLNNNSKKSYINQIKYIEILIKQITDSILKSDIKKSEIKNYINECEINTIINKTLKENGLNKEIVENIPNLKNFVNINLKNFNEEITIKETKTFIYENYFIDFKKNFDIINFNDILNKYIEIFKNSKEYYNISFNVIYLLNKKSKINNGEKNKIFVIKQ